MISLAGVSASGVATVLTNKYQKKLAKVTEFTDIVTSVLVVFEMSISKVLNDGKIDEWEFDMLQTLHLGVTDEYVNFDCKMETKAGT